MRAFIHYAATALIIPVYGINVCPYIKGLHPLWVIGPIGTALVVQFILRWLLRGVFVRKSPFELRASRVFKFEFSLFVITAVALMIFNTLSFGFPLASGMKLLVGITGLGFFAAIDLSLKAERDVISEAVNKVEEIDPQLNYSPLTLRMALFASVSVFFMIGVFLLVINHDLSWLVRAGRGVSLSEARHAIIVEFLFVLAVVLPHTLNIIYSYSLNMKAFFESENRVLEKTSAGDYSGRVPVCTSNEFGVMGKYTNKMVETVLERTKEVRHTRDVAIHSLASLAETRDNETGSHLLRTQRYVRALAVRIKDYERFSSQITDDTIDMLFKSAPLHDIGKVGIPDNILLKPGKLTDEEYAVMKRHPFIGADAMDMASKELGTCSFLDMARQIALTHHEKWDGSGYPNALSGEEIPLCGRLMALADVYDALVSKRVYKPALSHERAVEIITKGDGRTEPTHFDPDLLKAFIAVEGEFNEIAKEFSDHPVGAHKNG